MDLTSDEIKAKMLELWQECQKAPMPDIILCSPFPPYKGNLKRFWCKLVGHKMQPVQFVNLKAICDCCDKTEVEELPPIDYRMSTYKWWRQPHGRA